MKQVNRFFQYKYGGYASLLPMDFMDKRSLRYASLQRAIYNMKLSKNYFGEIEITIFENQFDTIYEEN